MLRAVRAGAPAPDPEVGAAADVLAALRMRGACFRPELAPLTGRLPAEVDEGLWDLVARGIVTADAFSAVRSLLSARDRWRTRTRRRPTGRAAGPTAARRGPVGTGLGEGRWSLLPAARGARVPAGDLASPARQRGAGRGGGLAAPGSLGRGGLGDVGPRVVPDALARGRAGPCAGSRPRGLVLGGRFVTGLSGEQYALPEAAEELAGTHRSAAQRRRSGGGRGRSAQRDRVHRGGARVCRPVESEGDVSRRRGGGRPEAGVTAMAPGRTVDLNADVGEAT